jgi:hypothetical protein
MLEKRGPQRHFTGFEMYNVKVKHHSLPFYAHHIAVKHQTLLLFNHTVTDLLTVVGAG